MGAVVHVVGGEVRGVVSVRGGGAARQKPSLVFFNGTATTEIYTLSLRDALPI